MMVFCSIRLLVCLLVGGGGGFGQEVKKKEKEKQEQKMKEAEAVRYLSLWPSFSHSLPRSHLELPPTLSGLPTCVRMIRPARRARD